MPSPTASSTARPHPLPWARDAIVYGVIPSRFGPRGLADVTARLDNLRDLGINTLWLSPITDSTPGDFGYEVTGHRTLRRDYGTPADMRRLVREAHERDMKVVMDFVPNHTHVDHPWYQDALAKGTASKYHSWYDRGADGKPTHYFDWQHLPNLNLDNPDVREHVLGSFEHWVKKYDVDGFRIDVAWGPQQRRPELWPALRQRMDATKPGVMLLAEASARDPYWTKSGFDAAYDWTDQLGQWSWHDVFRGTTASVEKLHRSLVGTVDASNATSALTMRFLDNNDTGVRFAHRHGPEMAKLGAALVMTLPGMPMVYTGEETGASYLPYDESTPLDFTDRMGLRDHYKAMIGLRKSIPALRSDEWQRYEQAKAPGTYGYLRGSGDEQALVLFNFSTRAHRVPVEPGLRDALTGEALSRDRSTVTLQPHSVRVLVEPGAPVSAKT